MVDPVCSAMRTRRKPASSLQVSERKILWAASAAWSAPRAVGKAAQKASPTVLKTWPPLAAMAPCMASSWRPRAVLIVSGHSSHSLLEPSISVNRKVTVPLGGATMRSASSFSLEGTIALGSLAGVFGRVSKLFWAGLKPAPTGNSLLGRRSVGGVGVFFGHRMWGVCGGRFGFVLGEPFVAFYGELRGGTFQPLREPPARRAQERHNGGYEHAPDDGRIDGDGYGHAESELLDGGVAGYHESEEDGDHDHGSGGDHTRRGGEAVDDSLVRVAGLFVLLADVGHEEDLVVHGEAEEDGEHHQRRVGDDAERGEDREHVHGHRLERDKERTEREHQQQERKDEDDSYDHWKLVRDLARQVDVAGGGSADVALHALSPGRLG